MLFKILGKDEFRSLVEIILASNEIIAPKRVGTKAGDEPIHQFLPIDSFEEMDLDYRTTEYSAKTYFLPYRENLCRFNLDDGDWEQEISYRIQPRAIIGLRAHDINALVKLDMVFIRSRFPSPYYISRRQNTFVVGLDHVPLEDEFSRSVGADIVTHGFDLFLTDLGDRYFVAIASDRGFNLLGQVEVREVTDQDTHDYKEVRRRIADGTIPVYQPGGPRSRILIHVAALAEPPDRPPTPPESSAAKAKQLPGPTPRWRRRPVMEY